MHTAGTRRRPVRCPPQVVCLASSPDCPVQAFRVGANTYATQFHPELDLEGICTRIDVYKNHGYFAPESAESLKAACTTTIISNIPRPSCDGSPSGIRDRSRSPESYSGEAGYSGVHRTAAIRSASSSSLRSGATPSATACRPTAWAIRTATSGTSGHAGNSGWAGSARAGEASPRVAAATRIMLSVTRVAWAAVTASPMAGKM